MPASWLWELPTSNLALDKNSTWGETKDGKKNLVNPLGLGYMHTFAYLAQSELRSVKTQ